MRACVRACVRACGALTSECIATAPPPLYHYATPNTTPPHSAASQVPRCRLVRSCLIRAHRVTLSTAYAYLGVIYDLYPRHPVFPVTGSALTNGGLGPETITLTERHQSALKRLVRLVLALGSDYEIPDIEHLLVPPSPRASPAPGVTTTTSSTSSNRPHSPSQQQQQQQQQQGGGGGDGFPPSAASSRSQTPANGTSTTAAAAAWMQPRLYLLRKGDSPHELDEQSRASIHIIVTGRLAVARVEAGSEVAAGGGRNGVGGGPGVGKSIFSDYSTSSACSSSSSGGTAPEEILGSPAPATPGRPSPSAGVDGCGSPFRPPSTPRMTSAALRGEVRRPLSLHTQAINQSCRRRSPSPVVLTHLHIHTYPQHGPGAVLGYPCLLTGAPEDWYTPRGKRRALLRLEAQTESWVLQVPIAFVDVAMKHNPFPTLALAARKVREVPCRCCVQSREGSETDDRLLLPPANPTQNRPSRRCPGCSAS